jgi:hypothetical protein
MKAQSSENEVTPSQLAKATNKGAPGWPLLPGIFLADFGLFLIGFAGWYALTTGSQSFLYLGGAILSFAGLVLVWISTIKLANLYGIDAAVQN